MTMTPLRVPKFVADGTVGIRKVFAGDYYNGTIEAFDVDEGWYSVQYDDGDVEDITERECAALVQEYNQQTVQPADRTTQRGNLKRRRQSTLVDTTSEEESDEDHSNTKRACKRGKRLPKHRRRQPVLDDDEDSVPPDTTAAQRRSNRRSTARAPTKKELALQAELADLLDRTDDYDDEDEDNNKSDDDSEPSFSEDGSSSEESAELDLVPTSEEEEESEESDEPTLRGAIRKLTAHKKKKKNNNGKQPGTRNRRQRSQNEEPPKQGRHQLSSADSSSDEDRGATASTPRGRRRRRIRKTKTINVDMLAEAERGHALHASSSSDDDDSDTAHNNDPPPGPREHLPLGNDGIIIPSLLARHLQKHQVEGVKFMHESVCVQGKGCVLAHCMGLGKTLQAVTLIATLLATPVEWEGDEGNLSIERKSVGVREEGAGRSRSAVTALEMPVGELRQELRNRGVNVTKIKKKELAELLELQWKQEAIPTKKKTAAGEVKDDIICDTDSDSDSDCGIVDDDSEPKDVFGNKKRRPRTVLVVCPVNVLLNWEAEFEKWLGDRAPIVYSLQSAGASNAKRAAILEEWHETGGVMICGYDQYRNLTVPTRVQNTQHRATFQSRLVNPGPMLVICDEGHILRNAASGLSRALNAIGCRRRIVLTGTPLQNNLSEYHCMINFVREGLLGTIVAFQRDFLRVIENGQCEDSTSCDVRLMKQRAHVLHGLLRVCVHRADLKVLEQYLPPKHEYALKVRMSPLQIKLYREYLSSNGHIPGAVIPQTRLFESYTHLAKVWTHPGVLKMERDDMGKTAAARDVKAYDSIDDFVCESSDEDWSDDEEEAASFDRNALKGRGPKRKALGKGDKNLHDVTKKEKKKGSNDNKDNTSSHWWDMIMENVDNTESPELSGKMLVMLQILKEASATKEKILLFSQSLLTLELIERVLEAGGGDGRKQRWKLGRDYFRIDGSTSSKTRQGWVERYNDRRNPRARLFLISTKAGGLGLNLSTATRIIIFDAAWNPSVDSQAVFRAYRFGQTKEVFVYRLLAAGTMEEKIYHRQVTKNALASRVLDKEQKNRHFKAQELENLYDFEPEGIEQVESDDDESGAGAMERKAQDPTDGVSSNDGLVRNRIPRFRNCTTAMPSDAVLVRLLGKMQPKWLLGYVDHDVLASGEGETELSEEEQAAAWAQYEAASKAQKEADAVLKAAPSKPFAAAGFGVGGSAVANYAAIATTVGSDPGVQPNVMRLQQPHNNGFNPHQFANVFNPHAAAAHAATVQAPYTAIIRSSNFMHPNPAVSIPNATLLERKEK